MPPSLEAQSLNHQTARQVPILIILIVVLVLWVYPCFKTYKIIQVCEVYIACFTMVQLKRFEKPAPLNLKKIFLSISGLCVHGVRKEH